MGVLGETRRGWKALWTSSLSSVIELQTDLPAVRRLFTLYDERERAYRAYRDKRLVRGSQGQWVLNPLWRQAAVMDAEIRQLEDRFGLTPRARLQLGITMGEAQKSIEEMNQRLQEDEDDGRDEDPRTAHAAS